MKYLIVKGAQGFGDRLEVLAMCIHFAALNNLQIYVDWTDPVWSHGSDSFYDYFDITNIPKLNSLDDIPLDATYYPPAWGGKIKEHCTSLGGQEYLSGVLTTQKFTEDVIVVSSVQSRSIYPSYAKLPHYLKLIHPKILDEVRRRNLQYSLVNCLGVHVRGTDRIGRQGREIPVQYLMIRAGNYTNRGQKPMVLISDDKTSIEVFRKYYNNAPVLSSLSVQNTQSVGNHLASKESLNISKTEMNIDMLIDFFTLTCCQRIITNIKDSRFAQMADRLKRIFIT